MHDYSYSAHLVINDGYEDRLDMKISCQNAQQLLRARDSFSDQMNTYIAEFAMQSNLVRMPSDEEQNTAALQAIIQEQTEKAKQQAPTEDITEESDPQQFLSVRFSKETVEHIVVLHGRVASDSLETAMVVGKYQTVWRNDYA